MVEYSAFYLYTITIVKELYTTLEYLFKHSIITKIN